jgi:hypothetical protein
MELVWLIVQASVLCIALLAVTCGLIWAPWYLLLAVLGIVLVSIHHFMPDVTRAVPKVDGAIALRHSAIASHGSLDGHFHPPSKEAALTTFPATHLPETHLIYRGVDYVLLPEHKGHSA